MAQVLRALPQAGDPALLVSPEHFDDAGVYRIGERQALVQTVDFFPPLVDDPFQFGQIAAANALSDVYAMGGRPVCCLNLLCFPDDQLPLEIAATILQGGLERAHAAGAAVVGGHSVRDAEIKYGQAVTGLVDPQRVVTNAGAQPGDVLVLTKPLGSGVLTTAFKKGQITEPELAPCVAVMIDLNRAACEVMLEVGVHAATDITGFGLIGHAHELAAASGVVLDIEVQRVPVLPQVMDLVDRKFVTRAHRSNLEHVGQRLDSGGVADNMRAMLADAQTSGGLLICVEPQRCDTLVGALKARGTSSAEIIGAVRPSDGSRTVRLIP